MRTIFKLLFASWACAKAHCLPRACAKAHCLPACHRSAILSEAESDPLGQRHYPAAPVIQAVCCAEFGPSAAAGFFVDWRPEAEYSRRRLLGYARSEWVSKTTNATKPSAWQQRLQSKDQSLGLVSSAAALKSQRTSNYEDAVLQRLEEAVAKAMLEHRERKRRCERQRASRC